MDRKQLKADTIERVKRGELTAEEAALLLYPYPEKCCSQTRKLTDYAREAFKKKLQN